MAGGIRSRSMKANTASQFLWFVFIIPAIWFSIAVIDKMFLQEIANAEIKKKYCILFFLYNLCSCIPEKCRRCLLPSHYIPVQDCGGELLRKIMGFPEKKCQKGR